MSEREAIAKLENEIFPNFAGRPDIDDDCVRELESAGIEVVRMEDYRDRHPEVKTCVRGHLQGWLFTRFWYYWSAKGPGIPPSYANELHEKHGKVVRVDGHCCCPSPLEWFRGFAVDHYHVDTQEGLNALASTIRRVTDEAAAIALQFTKPEPPHET